MALSNDIALAIELVEQDGFYFVVLRQPPHAILIPVPSQAKGNELRAGLRALINSSRSDTSDKASGGSAG